MVRRGWIDTTEEGEPGCSPLCRVFAGEVEGGVVFDEGNVEELMPKEDCSILNGKTESGGSL